MDSLGNYTLTREDTDRTLAYWSSLDSLSPEIQRAVMRASIVVVPDDGFREHTGPVFPAGTVEFFRSLRDQSPKHVTVEIAANELEYKEVALHYDLVRLAALVVEYIVAPAAAGLIVEYLKGRLGSRFSKSEVEASLTVDQSDGVRHKAWEIKYKGPAPIFEKVVGDAIASLPAPALGEPGEQQPVSQDSPK